jgi:hypothetical protein
MKSEGSLIFSQNYAVGYYFEPAESSPCNSYPVFTGVILVLQLSCRLPQYFQVLSSIAITLLSFC